MPRSARHFFFGRHAFVTPLALGAFFTFIIAFHIILPDMGGTYSVRNVTAWAAIALTIPILWVGPVLSGRLRVDRLWLAGLLLPILGWLVLIFINLVVLQSLPPPALFLPVAMLSGFAFLLLGMVQNPLTSSQFLVVLLLILIGSLPHYLVELTGAEFFRLQGDWNPFPAFVSKAAAGFAQTNLFGSYYATLVVLTGFAMMRVKRGQWSILAVLAIFAFIYGVSVFLMRSKTGFLGFSVGLALLFLHVLTKAWQDRDEASRAMLRHFAAYLGCLLLAWVIPEFYPQSDTTTIGVARDWTPEANSYATRLTSWKVSLAAFWDAPVFGQSLGAFQSVYYDYFPQFADTNGGGYLGNVDNPHNIFFYFLAETGLVGTLLVLGPLLFFGVNLLRRASNRWLLLALPAPILTHCLTEYPYTASGTHYWLFAFCLAAALAPSDLPSLRRPQHRAARYRFVPAFMLLTSASLAAFVMVTSFTVTLWQSTLAYWRSVHNPLPIVLAGRFDMDDMNHVLIGSRMTKLTLIMLVDRAAKENQVAMLRDLLLPLFEEQVLPIYRNIGVWQVGRRAYQITGDRDGLENLARLAEPVLPALAANIRATPMTNK